MLSLSVLLKMEKGKTSFPTNSRDLSGRCQIRDAWFHCNATFGKILSWPGDKKAGASSGEANLGSQTGPSKPCASRRVLHLESREYEHNSEIRRLPACPASLGTVPCNQHLRHQSGARKLSISRQVPCILLNSGGNDQRCIHSLPCMQDRTFNMDHTWLRKVGNVCTSQIYRSLNIASQGSVGTWHDYPGTSRDLGQTGKRSRRADPALV